MGLAFDCRLLASYSLFSRSTPLLSLFVADVIMEDQEENDKKVQTPGPKASVADFTNKPKIGY